MYIEFVEMGMVEIMLLMFEREGGGGGSGWEL